MGYTMDYKTPLRQSVLSSAYNIIEKPEFLAQRDKMTEGTLRIKYSNIPKSA